MLDFTCCMLLALSLAGVAVVLGAGIALCILEYRWPGMLRELWIEYRWAWLHRQCLRKRGWREGRLTGFWNV